MCVAVKAGEARRDELEFQRCRRACSHSNSDLAAAAAAGDTETEEERIAAKNLQVKLDFVRFTT